MNNKLHVYTGNGKGKTTAAMGLAVRSAGHGRRVLIAQFLKDGRSGELNAFKMLPNVEVYPMKPVSGFGIVVIFVGNRAMVYKLCAAIADIRGPVQTVTAFFFKIRACLVAGGAGSTFHATENNFSTGKSCRQRNRTNCRLHRCLWEISDHTK